MYNFSNKVLLISGSTRGIGRAIGDRCLELGGSVGFSGRKLDPSLNSANGFGFVGDLNTKQGAEAFVAEGLRRFGRIDSIVCNLGSGLPGKTPGEETLEEWSESIRTNLLSAVALIHAAKRALLESRGSIVCISSICASDSRTGPAHYSAAKSALEMLVRKFARSLGADGVRINAVEPGNIYFSGSTWDQKMRSNPESVKQMLATSVPLQRFGKPEEIANGVLFLLSDQSAFTTGSILKIDGGQSC